MGGRCEDPGRRLRAARTAPRSRGRVEGGLYRTDTVIPARGGRCGGEGSGEMPTPSPHEVERSHGVVVIHDGRGDRQDAARERTPAGASIASFRARRGEERRYNRGTPS